jgi:hypothetical protein
MAESIFRQEALERYAAGAGDLSDVVRAPRRWLTWCFHLVIGVAIAGGSFVSLARVDEYASGPAIVRAVGSTILTSPVSGRVSAVNASAGRRVQAGEVLADIEGAIIRAPFPAIVNSVRAVENAPLRAGDFVLSLTPDPVRYKVVIAFPAAYRPLVGAGSTARLELDGFPSTFREVRIDGVASAVQEPPELQRSLGGETSVPGPAFIAEGSVSTDALGLSDGLRGQAHARVRRSPLLKILLPWSRATLEPGT